MNVGVLIREETCGSGSPSSAVASRSRVQFARNTTRHSAPPAPRHALRISPLVHNHHRGTRRTNIFTVKLNDTLFITEMCVLSVAKFHKLAFSHILNSDWKISD